MDESLWLTMKGGLDAPARARAALVPLSRELGEKRDDVRLLVTEVVANAVIHAGVDHESFLKFGLSAATDRIRAELEYPGEQFTPRPQPEDRRFGLHLVDSLADSWGVERDEDKNHVWFETRRT